MRDPEDFAFTEKYPYPVVIDLHDEEDPDYADQIAKWKNTKDRAHFDYLNLFEGIMKEKKARKNNKSAFNFFE